MTTTASPMIVPPNEGGDRRPAHDSAEADSRAAHGETVSRLTRPRHSPRRTGKPRWATRRETQ